jgi:hypothetical protein
MRNAAIALFLLMGILGQTLTSEPMPSFTGRWEGVQMVQSDMPRVVADVILSVRNIQGQMSGEITFNSRARDTLKPNSKWIRTGTYGGPILSPGVADKVLTFGVSLRNSEGTDKVANFKMEMISANQAILEPAGERLVDMSARMTRKPGR